MIEQQTFTDHLTELRTCILRSLLIVIVGFAACVYFSEWIFDFIRSPIVPYLPAGGLVFTAPQDKFIAYLKVSLLAGMIVTCPLWLHQVWLFIAPGLYKHERKLAVVFIVTGSALFLLGVTFVYKLVYPMAFKYLLGFGSAVDTPMITIDAYLSFFITTTLVFGLAFEMPLIIVILGILGVIDHKMLRKNRRFAILGMAVLAAVVTPPDALSMLSLLAPLMFLYEASIMIVYVVGQKRIAAGRG